MFISYFLFFIYSLFFIIVVYLSGERKMKTKNSQTTVFYLLFFIYHFLFIVLSGCLLEGDPLEGSAGLDERLYGVWRFEWGAAGQYEEIRITREPQTAGNLGAFVYGGNIWTDRGFEESFAGDIVYAESFSDDTASVGSSGIIIIEYWPDHKQVWVDWDKAYAPYYFPPREDNPVNKNFYGIYFLNMKEDGTQVFLANTSDQSNNYGPTETETLEEAIAKFTPGNMNQLLDLSIGDPQHKIEDY
jgi:hypothetical protein